LLLLLGCGWLLLKCCRWCGLLVLLQRLHGRVQWLVECRSLLMIFVRMMLLQWCRCGLLLLLPLLHGPMQYRLRVMLLLLQRLHGRVQSLQCRLLLMFVRAMLLQWCRCGLLLLLQLLHGREPWLLECRLWLLTVALVRLLRLLKGCRCCLLLLRQPLHGRVHWLVECRLVAVELVGVMLRCGCSNAAGGAACCCSMDWCGCWSDGCCRCRWCPCG
jgi:hypothetical protein